MTDNILNFDPDTHTYTLDGVPIPSVTELVSVLGADYDQPDGDFELTIEAAAERGVLLHGYMAHRLQGGELDDYDLPSAYAGYADAVDRFLAEHSFEPYLIETPMWGRYDGEAFAGTPDYVGLYDGTLAILDYKFVSQVAKSKVGAQLNGYMSLAMSNDVYPEALYAVQFMKDGTYRLYQAGTAVDGFELCLSVFREKNKKHPRGRIA